MLTKLVETTIVGPKEYSKSKFLNESEKTVIIENKDSSKVEQKAKAVYTFPISRPNKENLNGRIYSEKLWKKTEAKMKGKSTFGLMDHPEEEGSTKDIWCVWKNLRFSENKEFVIADAYLVGHWGESVKDILEAGGEVGLSTSGFGEMLEDKKTIDPETYEIERFADFVFNPSYEVFGTQEDKVNKTNEETIYTEKANMSEQTKKEEKKLDKKEDFLAKTFRANMVSSFKQAKKIENSTEKINQLKELLTYFEEGTEDSLKKEIEEEIDFEKQEVIRKEDEFKESLNTQIETLKSENSDLQSKYKDSLELLDSVKVYSNKLKEMYDLALAEKNGMISASEFKEAQVYIESVEKERDDLTIQVRHLTDKLNEAKKKTTQKERALLKKRRLAAHHQRAKQEETEEFEDDEDTLDEEVLDESVVDNSNVNPDVLNFYNNLELSNPSVVSCKEDILRCRTLMEAQVTSMRLRPLWENGPSAYDRKVRRPKSTSLESSRQKLEIKKGWL